MITIKKSNVLLILIATIVIGLLVTGGLLLARNVDSSQKDSSEQENTPGQPVSDVGYTIISVGGAIQSEEYFNEYKSALNDNSTTVFNDIPTIDWNTQFVVPVEFYLPNGTTLQNVENIEEDQSLLLTALGPPVGCTYTAEQKKHVAFVVLTQGRAISQTQAKVTVNDNPLTCEI